MDRETVIALARKTDLWQMLESYSTEFGDGYVVADCLPDLMAFVAFIEEHLKSQGYRQCAVGQRTTQFCGMVEKAVKAEREACAQIAKQWDIDHPSTNFGGCIAAAIRSRT